MQQRIVRLSSLSCERNSAVEDMQSYRVSTAQRPHQRCSAFLGSLASRENRAPLAGRRIRYESSRPSSISRYMVSGAPVSRIFSISSRTRSAARDAASGAFFRMAAMVCSSISKPRRAEKRSARNMRSASSSKRSSGTPTQRMMRFCISAVPPNGSAIRPSGGSAIAFIVKSRRLRSALRSPTKLTASGCRWSA